LTIAQCATLACLLEITAPKPGNVHRGADFEDVGFADFAASAVAIGPAMHRAAETGVGGAVLEAIRSTRSIAATNTNLGIVLLTAPLAATGEAKDLPSMRSSVADVLSSLDSRDCRLVYEAIRLAEPGGMGKEAEMDVAGPAPDDLLAAMRQAADRDLVARQYADGYRELFENAAPWLIEGRRRGWSMTNTIVHTHVRLMSEFPDSLIARKCGSAVAKQSADFAAEVLTAGSPDDESFWQAVGDLDFWLRSDGHRRNPGTTADLITAALFVCLRTKSIAPPWR
jgi:triphosphoribosyl-dephospho-CoA synthase